MHNRGRVEVLGVGVDPVTADDVIDAIDGAVGAGGRLLVGHHNLHSTYLVRSDPEMQRFYERADVVYVDGMPLVWADRVHSRVLERRHRSTLLDWLHPLLDRAAERRWRVFLLGSTAAANATTVDVLAAHHPGATFAGRDGYFGDADHAEVAATIEAFGPDLLLVGMGMPRQERWLAAHFEALSVPVAMAVGGLFDYYAGASATPPRWMGRVGLEWLGRLAADPRRLGHRYLVEPVKLAAALARDGLS
jgi:N-acetylglucosaminyldiphosphoundecaprenol N-acetyl-beta-D-mannosaminyltransferase